VRKTVAVVGTVVDDEIRTADGAIVRSLGGIAYSVGVLSAIAGERLRILPVCRVGDDLAERVAAAWSGLPGVDLTALVPHAGPHTRVRLDYTVPGLGPGERVERLLYPMPPLRPGETAAAAGAHVVLVNCISGFDLERGAIPTGRRVVLDVHSLLLGRRDDGTRYPQRPDDADAWVAACDVLQCNRVEATTLTGLPASADEGAVERAVAGLLARSGRPRAALLTGGPEGVSLVQPGGTVSRMPPPTVVDGEVTGAGDAFGAGFVAAWIDELERVGGTPDIGEAGALERAAAAGVAVAAAACRLRGVDDLWRIPGFLAGAGETPDAGSA